MVLGALDAFTTAILDMRHPGAAILAIERATAFDLHGISLRPVSGASIRRFPPSCKGPARMAAMPRHAGRLTWSPKSLNTPPKSISSEGEHPMAKPRTLYDKIWDDHLVHEAEDGTCLLYIDRHLVHEVTSPQAFEGLRMTGRKVRHPEKTLAVVDHNVPTTDRTKGIAEDESRIQVETLAKNAKEFGIEYFHERDKRQGIVHVVGPEQGFTLPGTTIVCGDSHTSTHGAFGALAHGIGTSEVEHVLATQTLIQKKAKNMLVEVDGKLPEAFDRQGHHPRRHRRNRHGGRHRLGHRIRRRSDPRPLHGRPHDRLQHDHRGRRPRRHDRARREGLCLSRGPPHGAQGRGLGQGHGLLGDAADR